MRQNEKNIKSCMDIKDKEGQTLGAVCVLKGKDLEKNDILFMPTNDNAFSVRSVTELVNKLSRKNISYEERKKVLDFTSERLSYLENRNKNYKNDLEK